MTKSPAETARVGNGWFVAAAVVCLGLFGLFSWGRFALAEVLESKMSETIVAELEALAIPAGQRDRLKRELEMGLRLKGVLAESLRVGQAGAGTVFALLSIGYLRRWSANRATNVKRDP